MTETPIIKDINGNEVREVTSHQVEGILKTGHLSEEAADYLRYSAKACIGGTPRAPYRSICDERSRFAGIVHA